MVCNYDFDGKVTNLNCFYLHINFEQKYPKPAIVDLMASIWEKAISILAGNLNSGRSYLITTVNLLFGMDFTFFFWVNSGQSFLHNQLSYFFIVVLLNFFLQVYCVHTNAIG